MARRVDHGDPWTQFRAPEPLSPVPSCSQLDLWGFGQGPPAGPTDLEPISPTARAPASAWAYDAAELSRELDLHTSAGAGQPKSLAICAAGPAAEPHGCPTPESSLARSPPGSGDVPTTRHDVSSGDSRNRSSATFLVGSQFDAAPYSQPYLQPRFGFAPPNGCPPAADGSAAGVRSSLCHGYHEQQARTPQHALCAGPDQACCEARCEACERRNWPTHADDSCRDCDSSPGHGAGGSACGLHPELQSEAVVTELRSMSLPEARFVGSAARHSRLVSHQERREAKPARRLTTGTLEQRPLLVIQEDGHGGLTGLEGAFRKGVRKGRLSKEKADAATEKRKSQNVCIRCRLNRVAVGTLPPN
jgi:hypothetical protein